MVYRAWMKAAPREGLNETLERMREHPEQFRWIEKFPSPPEKPKPTPEVREARKPWTLFEWVGAFFIALGCWEVLKRILS